MRRSSGTVYFYVNGIQTPGTSASTPNTPNNYFTIGNELDSSNNPYRYFNGIIDEVRISNAANSPAWINASYEAERDHLVRWDSPWTPSGWHYRKSHIINSASGAGTNYQVKIKAYYGSGTDSGESVYLNFHSRTDFGDVRFTKDDGTTLLDYWIESKVDGDNAVFWVEVTDDLSSASRVIYLYYGKSDATTTGSGSSTFILFDDFNEPSLDGTKWTQKNGGTLTFASSQMTAPANNVDPAKIIATGGPTDNNRVLRARFKVTGGTDADERVGLGVKTGTADGKGYNYVFRDFTNLDERSFLDDGVAWNVRTSSWLKSTWYIEEVYHDGTNIKGRFDDGSWQSQTWSGRTGYLALNIGSKDSVTVWDWALVRKIVSPEPSHGSWGSEEMF
jgi:hypothetical protein